MFFCRELSLMSIVVPLPFPPFYKTNLGQIFTSFSQAPPRSTCSPSFRDSAGKFFFPPRYNGSRHFVEGVFPQVFIAGGSFVPSPTPKKRTAAEGPQFFTSHNSARGLILGSHGKRPISDFRGGLVEDSPPPSLSSYHLPPDRALAEAPFFKCVLYL